MQNPRRETAMEILSKTCNRCHIERPIKAFRHQPKKGENVRAAHCRFCYEKRNYGPENCFSCKVKLDNSNWGKSSRQKQKRTCLDCRRSYAKKHYHENVSEYEKRSRHLNSVFNITVEEYEDILTSQNGTCAICQKSERISGRHLAVDHCHDSKQIRGLLCAMCNTAIGKLGDSTILIKRALEYVQIHEQMADLAGEKKFAALECRDICNEEAEETWKTFCGEPLK